MPQAMLEQTLPQPPSGAGIPASVARRPLLKMLLLMLAFMRAGILLRWQFSAMQQEQKLLAIQCWARKVLQILEVEVHCNQRPDSDFAGLVVSNHLSWLDILVIQSLLPGVFVAKVEVGYWPLIGEMARSCATIFVDRATARSAHAMVDSMVAALEQRYPVIAFPEGTSTDGSDLGRFHANVFEGAIRAQTQVQPLSLRYLDSSTGLPAQSAHFTGDTSLLSSLREVLACASITAQVHLCQRIPTVGQTRKSLCQQTHRMIRAQLLAPSQSRERIY